MIKQWYVRKNGKFVKPRAFTAATLSTIRFASEREPTEAEAFLVLAELNDAITTVERIVRRMDATHALLQDCVREAREAREILVESNQQAALRNGTGAV